jgi:7,8-dihydropterin-6-yl-methyl-4-(beta-D-ribofuranosyl)aminobenzene 5'-phosphate synthase
MQIRISTLAENSASWLKLLAEWGLSILVEMDDITVLVDTGASGVAAHNARAMGIDMKSVDKILFSHGHIDHVGGLLELLEMRKNPVEVIAHPDVWAPKYWQSTDGSKNMHVGIPYQKELAESMGASFNLTKEPVWLTENMVTSGEVPMVTDYEAIDAGACVKSIDGLIPDPLWDDQSLFIKSERGLLIISGCAHRGIVNTLLHAQNLTGCKEIYAVIGGTHLVGASDQRIEQTIEEFKRLDIQKIGVSHCTGPVGCMRLAQAFGDRFFFNLAGTCTTLEL